MIANFVPVLSRWQNVKMKIDVPSTVASITNLVSGYHFYQCYTAAKTCRRNVYFIKKKYD